MNKDFFKVIKRVLFFVLMIILTPILVVEGIISIIKKHKRKKNWEQTELDGKLMLSKTGITDIDIMDGYMFEDYLKILFFYNDYTVQNTKKSRDYGADLILTDKNNNKIIVQAKRYSKPVGSRAIQEILAAKLHYNAIDAWVVTNNIFTPQAELLAKENSIRLIDRKELIELYSNTIKNLGLQNADGNLDTINTSFKEKYPFYI